MTQNHNILSQKSSKILMLFTKKSQKLHQIYTIISTTKCQKEKKNITESLKTHYDIDKKKSKMKIRVGVGGGGGRAFCLVFHTFDYQNHPYFTILPFYITNFTL